MLTGKKMPVFLLVARLPDTQVQLATLAARRVGATRITSFRSVILPAAAGAA